MATVTRENTGLLTDKITVNLSKEDYYPAFEKALKKYSAQAKIPGFRPGMVPVAVVKKMYGASAFTDEVLRTMEKEINGYLDQEKPDIFAQPLPTDDNADILRQMDMNQPGSYSFSFEMGLKPNFETASLPTASINRRRVKVTDEMVAGEISRLQTRYGNMKDLETVESDQDLIEFEFAELDAVGNLVDGGVNKSQNLLVNYFTEAIRPQLSGLKKDDTITITINEAFAESEKEFIIKELGLEADEAAGEKKFRLTIKKIGLLEKRELNLEFFEQLLPGKNIETAEAFTEGVKEDIEGYWEQQARTQVHDEIYHYLIDNTQIDLPESFLKRWIQNGGEKRKSAEEAEAEYPAFVNSLKWELISSKLLKENNLSVTPDELREFAKQQIMAHMGVTKIDESVAWLDAYVDRMMKDEKYIDQNYHQLLNNKLFGWAESQVTNFKDNWMSAEDFAAQQHHHHH